MTRPELVVFDMAGTTVEDAGQVPGAFMAALTEHGLALSTAELGRVRGASKREAIRRLLPETDARYEQAEHVYASFKARLAERFSAGVAPIPGAAEVFSWLRRQGTHVALNTGFDRDIVDLLIPALGWESAVDAIVTADDVEHGRPAPDLLHAAMQRCGVERADTVAAVGDTALDLEAGLRAGVGWNIGVLSGAHDRATLERAPHTHLVSSVAELPGLWSSTD
ncbi:MAG: phosphonatase-like hydrolase [Gemmatimonadota bacterium]